MEVGSAALPDERGTQLTGGRDVGQPVAAHLEARPASPRHGDARQFLTQPERAGERQAIRPGTRRRRRSCRTGALEAMAGTARPYRRPRSMRSDAAPLSPCVSNSRWPSRIRSRTGGAPPAVSSELSSSTFARATRAERESGVISTGLPGSSRRSRPCQVSATRTGSAKTVAQSSPVSSAIGPSRTASGRRQSSGSAVAGMRSLACSAVCTRPPGVCRLSNTGPRWSGTR